jgi:hypothetical protein
VEIVIFLEGEMGTTVEEFWEAQQALAISLASHRARTEGNQPQVYVTFNLAACNLDDWVFEGCSS